MIDKYIGSPEENIDIEEAKQILATPEKATS